jgi:electron transfer flavoprotein beta subunit
MAAKTKEIRRVTPAAPVRHRQEIVALYVPQKTKQTEIIAGSAAEAASTLVRKLREDARVIA